MTEQPARARDRGDAGLGAPGATEHRGLRSRSVLARTTRTVLWAAAYAAATWLGAGTVAGDSGFALFWPASGIALAWIATSPDRLRVVELVLVGLLAALGARELDMSWWAALNGFVGVPLSLLVFLHLSRRWAPGLWGTGGTAEIEVLRQYGQLLAAVGVAGLVEAAVALVLLLPGPGPTLELVGELGLTHTIAMGSVGVTLLVLGGKLANLPAVGRAGRLACVRSTITRNDLLLTLAGLAVTVVVMLAGFLWVSDAPVSFVLVMAVALVAIRYGAPLTGLYALTVVTAAAAFTAAGHGPLAAIAEPHRRALAFGIFSATLVGTGLTIALSRRERDTTIGRLRESEHAAEVLADDLSLVLANLEEGVAVVEEGGRFIHANPAIGRLLRIPDFNTDRVQPVDSYELVHPDGSPLLESEVPHVRAFAGEEEVRDVLRLGRQGAPGERVFEVFSRLLPQLRPTDRPRAVTTIRDVTAEHEQRDALASFAQVVAHDLRSPLTSVELWAEELLDTLGEGPVDAETAAMMLRHIQSAAGRMQNFISDLLAYALARDQKTSPTRIELEEVVESVVETIGMVEDARPQVRFHDLPAVWCDPVLLPQLFDNLISNARKYVAPGVVPSITVEGDAENGWAHVRVIDNGVGIAPEDRSRVFETFERARATDYEGTGLGLAICRHIVERHGGAIGVTTPPGVEGTWIELTLPATEDAFAAATGASHS